VTDGGEIGWDDPETVKYYEAFCERHSRYADANRALVAHAEIEPHHRVLDVGAGTGRTAAAVLEQLVDGSVTCVEPAAAMRAAGRARLRSPRVSWSSAVPECGNYDRILCGASIWLMLPLSETLPALRQRLAPVGALCFNIPSLYLGRADQPGEGLDPLLLELPALIARGQPLPTTAAMPLPTAEEMDRMLDAEGLIPTRWELALRLTQAAYRDWLKIPPTTNVQFRGMPPVERAACIDQAFEKTDQSSWRWEHWTGWTARVAPSR
jgi:SAM-dependent methyltransferase